VSQFDIDPEDQAARRQVPLFYDAWSPLNRYPQTFFLASLWSLCHNPKNPPEQPFVHQGELKLGNKDLRPESLSYSGRTEHFGENGKERLFRGLKPNDSTDVSSELKLRHPKESTFPAGCEVVP
jgi:hypothetical protein